MVRACINNKSMKSLLNITTIIIFFVTVLNSAYGQSLSANAQFIKQKYPSAYENNIKKFAILEWKEDYAMVLYEINKQSDAFASIYENLKSEHVEILFRAILEWSREGKRIANSKKLSQLKSLYFSDLIDLECDWSMVKYEYEKQVKAKLAF